MQTAPGSGLRNRRVLERWKDACAVLKEGFVITYNDAAELTGSDQESAWSSRTSTDADVSGSAEADQPGRLRRFYVRRERAILGIVAIAVVLGSWQLAATLNWVNPEFSSSPSQIVASMGPYFTSGTGWTDLWATTQEFLIGFSLAVAIGVPLGILMGSYSTLDGLAMPMVSFLNNTPRIALAPLFVIWFGIGIASKVGIVLSVATVPLIINARAGVSSADRSLVNMARSYGTSKVGVLVKVVLPASVPAISAGFRIAIGQGLQAVVLAEFIAASKGLGYTLFNAASTLNTARLFDAVILIAGFGLILTALATKLERYFDRWRA